MFSHRTTLLATSIVSLLAALATPSTAQPADELVGVWRGSVTFADGPFAAIKDLEFLYAFNAGGTMTESSNYDAAPPVPPAYGIWRRTGPRTFESKYIFYATQAPAKLEDITGGGGWLPAGHGIFTERITLSSDGRTFTSTMRYEQFDTRDVMTTSGTATVAGRRVEF
jgi:hypothetical protein